MVLATSIATAVLLTSTQARPTTFPSEPPLPPVRASVPPVQIPMPPERPAEIGRPTAPPFGPPPPPLATRPPPPLLPEAVVITPPSPPPDPLPDSELVCARLFGDGKVVARAIAPVRGEGGCGIAAPIELSAVIVTPARQLGVSGPVEIDCALGAALADWLRDDLVPLFDKAGRPLTGLTEASGYACRGRNRVVGAKMSEHARGDAVDIGGFVLADRTIVGVKNGPAPLLAEIKRTACARFATVLGPGSDGYHDTHLHLDLEPRRNHVTLCQWTLP